MTLQIPGSGCARGRRVLAQPGGEGDYLDAVVLGPRLALGSTVQVKAYGAVGLWGYGDVRAVHV